MKKFVVFLIGLGAALIEAQVQRFEDNDSVPVLTNKIWPANNRQETYSYYDKLPLCRPESIQFQQTTLGQVLFGDRPANSLKSSEPIESQTLCTKDFTTQELLVLQHAIKHEYLFEFLVGSIPVNSKLGKVVLGQDGEIKYMLALNHKFILGHNGKSLASAALAPDSFFEIEREPNPVTLTFSYSVEWESSEINSTTSSFQRYNFCSIEMYNRRIVDAFTRGGGMDVHWLAIINSFVLVLFVASLLLFVIMKVVRSDLARYLRIPDEELVTGEEDIGWKLLHADVFRSPPHRMWFCACVGSGAHILLVVSYLSGPLAFKVVITSVSACFSAYIQRGALLSAALLGYLLTSFVAGSISANLYRRLGGQQWILNIFVTVFMFMGPVFLVWSILNSIGIAYNSTAALPFSTSLSLFLCWIFSKFCITKHLPATVTTPLTVLGAIVGRKHANQSLESKTPFPCKTNRLAREIPRTHWKQSPWTHVLLSGFLPFSAIYIELHFVLLSVWGSRIYSFYGILLLAFILLVLVAGTVSVLLTYSHLNGEDYRWWWRSFLCGGSVAMYFLLHCLYYFMFNTTMVGVLQCAFFFGYSLVVAWALFLMLGFVTFVSNYVFVNYIYSSIKSD